jgi:hypothetical protein
MRSTYTRRRDPKADLRSLVVAVITTSSRHFHPQSLSRLMVAIENNQTLVDESLMDLERAAEDTRYQLPRLTQVTLLDRDRAPSASQSSPGLAATDFRGLASSAQTAGVRTRAHADAPLNRWHLYSDFHFGVVDS